MSDNQADLLSSFRPLARASAADELRRQLIDVIESGELLEGDQLPTEAELGKAFGVSRPVVREALMSLRALGLISTQPGRGTFVASSHIKTPLALGPCSSSDLNEVRRYLEVPAARLTALRRTDDDLVEIDRILQANLETAEPRAMVGYDAQFHIAIARASRNPLMPRLISELRGLLEEQSLAVLIREGRGRRAMEEHALVAEAVRAGDPDAAAAAMEAHLRSVEQEVAMLGEEATAAQLRGRRARRFPSGSPRE